MTALRKGWCPGALRPMATGDGFLVRVRVTGGILGFSEAKGLAACAKTHGNGLIDLTSQANLQIRGVMETGLAPVQAILGALGLLDDNAEAEAVRNVVASPLAGFDPDAVLDIRPMVLALEKRLATDTALHALPTKFSFAIDDGGRLGLGDVAADVRFEAVTGPAFGIFLAGMPAAVGFCAPPDVPEVAAWIARAFLRMRQNGTRLRDVIADFDLDGFLYACPFLLETSLQTRRAAIKKPRLAGLPFPDVVGATAPFGRMIADDLKSLADIASRFGATDLRLSPWRTIFVTRPRDPHGLVAALAGTGLIVDPDDPRLTMSACPGQPACARASTSTFSDAAKLALLGAPIHVSGCAKGCGQTRPGPFTLVAEDGRYNLVLDGTARENPIERGLSLTEAYKTIAARMAGEARA